MKNRYPIQTVEFASTLEIDQEPALSWWARQYLHTHDIIVAAVNRRTSKASHKYGIKVSVFVKQAIDLDQRNKDIYWQDALSKEMRNICAAFEILDDSRTTPI